MRTRVFTVFSVLLFALAAHASTVVYNFHGVCTDCSNDAPFNGGNGLLTLSDYTAGDDITSDNFVSFVYNSDILTNYSFYGTDEDLYISGSVGLGAQDYLNIHETNGKYFNANASITLPGEGGPINLPQNWCTGNSCLADYGTTFTFTSASSPAATPEPGSLALLGTGMASLAALRKRRK